jgi:hypothetical protein
MGGAVPIDGTLRLVSISVASRRAPAVTERGPTSTCASSHGATPSRCVLHASVATSTPGGRPK